MKRHLPAGFAVALALLLAAACSSSSSSSKPAAPLTGTETLSATVTGAAAAANLNNSNSSAPLDFPEGVWDGLVNTTVKPFALGGNSNAGNVHWATPAGTVTVYHASAPGYTSQNAPPPATWVKTGTDCTAHATLSKGTFALVPAQSTGEFARLSGTGSYALVAQFTAPLTAGKTVCSFSDIGKITDNGALIAFTATAPATLKPATS